MKKEHLPSALASTPGVYLYKNAAGDVLYVGKAKSLRSRVLSYFRDRAALDPAKRQMISRAANIQTISTDTETEALVLEANLIRTHQPPYNVVLRDDKYYLFIKITKEKFPQIFPARKILKDRAQYFGPYSSARSVRETLRLLRRIFPHRSEHDSPREITFPHPLFTRESATSHVRKQNKDTYRENIHHIIQFLQGNRKGIIATIARGMAQASALQEYERASIFRDQLRAIERLEGTQKVFLPRRESFDAVSIARAPLLSAANIFQIRDGKLLNKHTFLLKHRTHTRDEDMLRQFLLQYYSVAQDIPPVILIPLELNDEKIMSAWIATKRRTVPKFTTPRRGIKKQLIAMGEMNAKQLLIEQEVHIMTESKLKNAHTALITALSLDARTIHRIETYDISNIQGSHATASMVVYIDGQSHKDQYRKFRMTSQGPNDIGMLKEIMRRRFAKKHMDAFERWPLPELIVIDGGKGQLSGTHTILVEHDIQIPIIAIAKREETIFIPHNFHKPSPAREIRLPYDSDALYLIQRMRDEAHRFTLTYHKLLRSKEHMRSILDEIPGIGPKTKKKLLNRFGSLKAIRAASEEELTREIGNTRARELKACLS